MTKKEKGNMDKKELERWRKEKGSLSLMQALGLSLKIVNQRL